jgi:hypothetical protein
MTLPRALAIASVLLVAGVTQAVAQFPPPPGQSGASPFPPPPGQSSPFPSPPGQGGPPPRSSPFPAPGQQAGGHACEAFLPIRQAAENGAAAIRAAGERKATREEVCPLFKTFTAAEAKMVKFMEKNQSLCGVPADAVKQVKANHTRTVTMRNQVCSAGPAPRGPSLSDALGGPLIPSEAPKPGRGTFDTLTGSPLGR